MRSAGLPRPGLPRAVRALPGLPAPGTRRARALALLAVLLAAAALALEPFPGLARAAGPVDGPDADVAPVAVAPVALAPVAARPVARLGPVAAVAPAGAGAGTASRAVRDAVATPRQAAEDDGGVEDDADDDGTPDDGSAADDDGQDDAGVVEDDGSEDDDAGLDLGDDEDDTTVVVRPVAVDRRNRALSRPGVLAASRSARGSGLRWNAWGAATATGTGRLAFRTAGRRPKAVRGTGTVRLSRLKTCGDGTARYRRAVFAVPRRGRVVVTLPGCPAAR